MFFLCQKLSIIITQKNCKTERKHDLRESRPVIHSMQDPVLPNHEPYDFLALRPHFQTIDCYVNFFLQVEYTFSLNYLCITAVCEQLKIVLQDWYFRSLLILFV